MSESSTPIIRRGAAERWVCLLSVLVVGAASATASSASSLPELGRCSRISGEKVGKKTVYHGGYKNSSCTKASATRRGRYEWLPGPGAHPKFKDTVGKLIAKTVGRPGKYTCAAGTGEGEYVGASQSVGATTYTGCEIEVPAGIASCQSFGASRGVVKTTSLEGELGFIKGGAKPSVGTDLKPTPASYPYLLVYECGGVELLEEGSVIAPITPIDVMTSTFTEKYSEVDGRQIPEMFEGGPRDVLIAVIPTQPPSEQAGVEATLVATTEEPLEIRAKS